MSYFIGVDIGTTSVKAVAFDNNGLMVFKHSSPNKTIQPKEGWQEQIIEDIFTNVITSIQIINQKLFPVLPTAIGFSAAMHSLIAIDENNLPLTNCIIWSDNRSNQEAEALHETGEYLSIYQTTGVPIHPMSPLCKIIWLQEKQPAIFKKASKFVGIKEYIFYQLFGQYVIDIGTASATGLMNIHTLQWDESILQKFHIKTHHLSTIKSETKAFFLPLKNKWQLPATLPFIVGGSDGALANLGMGVLNASALAITIGTSAAVRLTSNSILLDDRMKTFCYYLKNGSYVIGGASNNGGILMQWLKETFFEAKETVEEFYSHAYKAPVASDGLFVLPYLLGERAPIWNSTAKAMFIGLSEKHTKAHIIRAAMEAIIFNLQLIAEPLLMKNMQIQKIYAGGGFAENDLWLQMAADIFNLPVYVNNTNESSAFGAAMLAAEAVNENINVFTKAEKIFKPITENNNLYKQQYRQFKSVLKKFYSM